MGEVSVGEKLSAPMLMALQRLYQSKQGKDFVHMTTSGALIRRGLAESTRRFASGGGNLPHDELQLSDKGRRLCQARFKSR